MLLLVTVTLVGLVAFPVLAARIQGTSGDDRLIGTPRSDTVHGLGGDDDIEPRAGNDVVFGGRGQDSIDVGWSRRAGDDLVYAGRGDDDVSSGPGDVVHLGPGHDQGWTQGGDGAVVRGGEGFDVLAIDTGAARLYGGPGNDVLCGPYLGGEGRGPYRYWLGSGNDRAFAPLGWCYEQDNAWGRDVVHAGSGADFVRFSNGSGHDAVYAGPGDDTVIVANRRHRIVHCGPGQDTLVLRHGAEPPDIKGCEDITRE